MSLVLGNASLNSWSRCGKSLALYFMGSPSLLVPFFDFVQLFIFRFWRLWLLLATMFGLHRVYLLVASAFSVCLGSVFTQLGVKCGWLVGDWVLSFFFGPMSVPRPLELTLHNVSASSSMSVSSSLGGALLQAAVRFVRQHRWLAPCFGTPAFIVDSVILLFAWHADR
jgi:hypothetical protein